MVLHTRKRIMRDKISDSLKWKYGGLYPSDFKKGKIIIQVPESWCSVKDYPASHADNFYHPYDTLLVDIDEGKFDNRFACLNYFDRETSHWFKMGENTCDVGWWCVLPDNVKWNPNIKIHLKIGNVNSKTTVYSNKETIDQIYQNWFVLGYYEWWTREEWEEEEKQIEATNLKIQEEWAKYQEEMKAHRAACLRKSMQRKRQINDATTFFQIQSAAAEIANAKQ